MASELRVACDPRELMVRAGKPPDAWQSDYLGCDAQEVVLLAARQCGKSESTAASALHPCMYPGAYGLERFRALVIGAAERQAHLFIDKVYDQYASSPAVPLRGQRAKGHIEFDNGSSIVALPAQEATIRSFSSINLLILDEAARIPDAIYAAARPFLAVSRGKLRLLSSAFGRRGFFYDSWVRGLPDDWEAIAQRHIAHVDTTVRPPRFERGREATDRRGAGWLRFKDAIAQASGKPLDTLERYYVTVDDCPRVDDQFLQVELERTGSWWWLQEWYGVFHENVSTVFPLDAILGALGAGGVDDAMAFAPPPADSAAWTTKAGRFFDAEG